MSVFHSGIEKSSLRAIFGASGRRIHFIGAGGVGLYSLARLALARGHAVSGSDIRPSRLLCDLILRGADIRIGHAPELLSECALAVYTLAIAEDDPELLAAEAAGVPISSRAELLGAVMENYTTRIGISGSHGKSTTTAMIDAIYRKADRSPTTLVGANLPITGLPVRIGGEETLIYEACEYKDSFLHFSPTHALYTSLELDHTDYFKTEEAIISSFRQSARTAGRAVLNADDSNLLKISKEMGRGLVTYGEESGDIRGEIKPREEGKYSLKIRHASGVMPEILLNIPARYNARNALSAAALAITEGVGEDAICSALSDFSGIERRLEPIGKAGDFSLYYDYAHHPTEIASAISALREISKLPVTVIFKPHTYSRTRAFQKELAAALSLADRVVLLEVDPVRESPDQKASSEVLLSRISATASLVPDGLAASLSLSGRPSSVVLMGAGDVSRVLSELKSLTRVKKSAENGGE